MSVYGRFLPHIIVEPVEGTVYYVGAALFAYTLDTVLSMIVSSVTSSVTNSVAQFLFNLTKVVVEVGITLAVLRMFFQANHETTQMGCVVIAYIAAFLNLGSVNAFSAGIDVWVGSKITGQVGPQQ